MIENLTEITKDVLVGKVHAMKDSGYRFITASCCDNGDNTLDVFYHFDKDMKMESFKMKVAIGEEIQSVSKVYFCALLVENEMKELFGLNVSNMAIDYGGHLLLSDGAPESPMSRSITIVQKEG